MVLGYNPRLGHHEVTGVCPHAPPGVRKEPSCSEAQVAAQAPRQLGVTGGLPQYQSPSRGTG